MYIDNQTVHELMIFISTFARGTLTHILHTSFIELIYSKKKMCSEGILKFNLILKYFTVILCFQGLAKLTSDFGFNGTYMMSCMTHFFKSNLQFYFYMLLIDTYT